MNQEKEGELIALFNSYDQNGDGVISADELKSAFSKLGQSITDEEIVNMVRIFSNYCTDRNSHHYFVFFFFNLYKFI